LDGYVDIHSHVMWGFDDGANSLDETLEILRLARRAGFVLVAATPHIMQGVYQHERPKLEETIREVKSQFTDDLAGLDISPGAEYYLDENFYGLLDADQIAPLGSSRHVLVELPLLRIPPMARDWAFRMRIKGYVPILAHPERYADVGRKPQEAAALHEAGYLIQINLGSLIGMYGRSARKAGEWLLKQGLVDFAASDAHTPQQAAVYGEGVPALAEIVGRSELERILIENPRQVLAGC